MNEEKLNKDLQEFFKSKDNHSPVTVTINLSEKSAYAYRLVHIMLENADLPQAYDRGMIDKQIFLTGLIEVDRNAQSQSMGKDS